MGSDNFNFENAIKELEKIATDLEDENTTVDQSVELFEKGIKLSKDCSKYLETVKQKITTLSQYESEGLQDD